ncbi:MAG TPA: IS200/IS605 family transposase, partial [Firmicutes bacterium]|nr:IS200/IS605 family transposase [Bacillota bacterium]
MIRELCERKDVEIIEVNACQNHIEMLVSMPSKLTVSTFMSYLKEKSSLMISDRHIKLKYVHVNRKFWCRGCYGDTVKRNR